MSLNPPVGVIKNKINFVTKTSAGNSKSLNCTKLLYDIHAAASKYVGYDFKCTCYYVYD